MISQNISERVSWAIEFGWRLTIEKIVNGEIKVSKEASLQLHYASILKNLMELIKFSPKERYEVDLETTVYIGLKPYIIDILITYSDGSEVNEKHSIELKCYKTKAASGKARGANDIFMYSVYIDLFYSELYTNNNHADHTTCLILTDYPNFVNPKKKDTKNWIYDISHGNSITGGHFTTSIGGKPVNFNLIRKYTFNWLQNGMYWSLLIRPE
jgi:hypothetical protein